ncbi:hypothetical protein AALB_3923 [Agarivorans albus MKT 106]|uniref:Uncharacterized protein n=1 Tax=Agarivorans albus MKT 106 TaxID=1331007 RepID=R9PRF6_AGAAL|nr:hypothetical protein AALB_3923 [Agarivorans albus MKT 106]
MGQVSFLICQKVFVSCYQIHLSIALRQQYSVLLWPQGRNKELFWGGDSL